MTSTSGTHWDAATVERRVDEWANSLTHGVGFVASVIGAVALMSQASLTGGTARLGGCAIYVTTLVAVYAASTLSHVFAQRRWRRLFRTLDQAFIYLLIAGSYTPLALLWLHGGWLTGLFVAIWVIALFGFFSKLILQHRVEGVSLTLYGVLGWLPAAAIPAAWLAIPHGVLWLFFAGGLFYTLGMVFLIFDQRVRYFHAAWHVMVMAGSVCHYVAIFWYVARPAN